jgi:ribosome biogenesis GTPase
MTRAGPPVALAPGRVVASYGGQADITDSAGQRHTCRLHGRRLQVTCGDEILWGMDSAGDAVALIYEVLPRRTVLSRLTGQGRTEPIVANLTQLLAVVATVPEPDFFIVDRYLAGAAWASIHAAVVFNKIDLLPLDSPLLRELTNYASLGYPVLRVSSRAPASLSALQAQLQPHTSVLVGQSGAGKSSLLNALVPAARAITQEISAATELGKHTTTTSALHRMEHGGELIDSPGVRDYSPPLPAPREIATGFCEIYALAANCRFQDCLHLEEPACAVRAGLNQGVSERRYQSYRRLLQLSQEMAQKNIGRDRRR